MAEGDPATGQVVWGELDDDTVAREHTNVVLPHASTKMPEHLVPVLQLDLELRVRQGLKHRAFDGDCVRVLPARSRLRGRCWRHSATSALLLLLCLCLLYQMYYLISYTQ